MIAILRPLLLCIGIILTLLQPATLLAEQKVPAKKETIAAGSQDQACETRLLEQLGAVADPEFEISIIDFGLVREVRCDALKKINTITIIPTSPLCPYLKEMVADIKAVSTELYPQREARVIVDMETGWSPSLMTAKGKKMFWGEE